MQRTEIHSSLSRDECEVGYDSIEPIGGDRFASRNDTVISANGAQRPVLCGPWNPGLATPGLLHAYDPANLAHEFTTARQPRMGATASERNKFITPVSQWQCIRTQNGRWRSLDFSH